MIDYQIIISQIAILVGECFPVALCFGITAKLFNFAMDMILNRKISL